MKKIALVLFTLFVLSSCGSTSNTTDESTKAYTASGFTINIPTTWTVVNKNELPAIKSGQVELAVSSSDISSGFANNLVVIWQDLLEKTTSKQYSIINYSLSTWEYVEFTKLSEKTVNFSDKDQSNLYIFEAKYNTATPKRKFLQTAKICWSKVYLLTIWIALGTTDTTRYENLITSFTCK